MPLPHLPVTRWLQAPSSRPGGHYNQQHYVQKQPGNNRQLTPFLGLYRKRITGRLTATERRHPARETRPPVSRPHRLTDRRQGKRHGQRLQPLPACSELFLLGHSAGTAADGPLLVPLLGSSGENSERTSASSSVPHQAARQTSSSAFSRQAFPPPEMPPPLHFRVRSYAITAELDDGVERDAAAAVQHRSGQLGRNKSQPLRRARAGFPPGPPPLSAALPPPRSSARHSCSLLPAA